MPPKSKSKSQERPPKMVKTKTTRKRAPLSYLEADTSSTEERAPSVVGEVQRPFQHPDDLEPDEYEVKAIVSHERLPAAMGGKLEYTVSWVGFPDEKDNSKLSEEGAATCPLLLKEYWKRMPPKRRKERYTSEERNSGKGKRPPPPVEVATDELEVEASVDSAASIAGSVPRDSPDRPMEDEPRKRRRTSPPSASRSRSNPAERRSSMRASTIELKNEELEDALILLESGTSTSSAALEHQLLNGDERDSVDTSMEDDKYGTQDDEDVGESYQQQVDYSRIPDWEDLVSHFADAERDENGTTFFLIVWKHDDAFSWISLAVARAKCPQLLINFYEKYSIFRDMSAKEESEEPTLVAASS